MFISRLSATFLIAAIFLFTISPVSAGTDITVTCDNSDCSLNTSAPLFSESNIAPGQNFSQKITAINERNKPCELNLETKSENENPTGFSNRLFTSIQKNLSDIFGTTSSGKATNTKTLNDVYNASSINFGALGSSSTTEFTWNVTFDSDAGNEYQGADTGFDFDLNFTCEEPEEEQEEEEEENGNGDDNNDGDGDSSDGGSVSGTFTSRFPFYGLGGIFVPESTTSASTIEENPEPELPTDGSTPPQILGLETDGDLCINPWWWLLVYVAQIIIQTVINYFSADKEKTESRKRFYVLQILSGVLFFIVFFYNFCFWWDYLVSILLSIIGMYFIYRLGKRETNIPSGFRRSYSQL